MVIDGYWFFLCLRFAVFLDPHGFYNISMAIGGFFLLHFPYRDLGISMGSLVTVEPSRKGLSSEATPRTTKPF
jgi:hypothetical protein